jgi:glutamate dehydrogenase
MPFLLDSVIGALGELGLAPELVAHPIFEVRRDARGQMTAIDSAGGPSNGMPRESFIHLQIRKTGPLPPPEELESAIGRVLSDVRTVVQDFKAIRDRVGRVIEELEQTPPPATAETNAEAVAFLRWLTAGNFTFLGLREYDYCGNLESGDLVPKPETALGLLRDTGRLILRRSASEQRLTPQIRALFLNFPPVIVAKGNEKSTVHRRVHMDIIAIKLHGEGGKITGQLRIAGLFTASAYNLSTLSVPLLRQKTTKVLRGSGYPAGSFSERALLNVLETFPRDELFQISTEQLVRVAEGILKTSLTPRPRVFIRRDGFERFISAFVYVPRERYNTRVRVEIVKILEEAFGGHLESFTPFFPEGSMVRIHIVLWRDEGSLKDGAEESLERKVEQIIRTWDDDLRKAILDHYGEAGYRIAAKYLDAFPAGYQETNTPERALEDIQRLEKLGPHRRTDIDIYRDDPSDLSSVRATLQQLDEPLSLSKRVPILENFGFDAVSERTFQLTPNLGGETRCVYLHDTIMHLLNGGGAELLSRRVNLEDGFLAAWSGAAANDRFNGLILAAGLGWRQAALLRAYSAYLRQTGTPYGPAYVSEVLNKHPGVAADLVALFDAMFNPANGLNADGRNAERARISEHIAAKLDIIPVLDEDRILRNVLTMIRATLRTNFYQGGDEAEIPKPSPSNSVAARSSGFRRPSPSLRFSSTHPGSRVSICVLAPLRAAAYAGRTGRRISGPRF